MNTSESEKLKELCRFCLRKSTAMRRVSTEDMPKTDIPRLYEIITAVKLDILEDYSDLICSSCEEQMTIVGQIRSEFLKVDQLWKSFLYSGMTDSVSYQWEEHLNSCIKEEPTVVDTLAKQISSISPVVELILHETPISRDESVYSDHSDELSMFEHSQASVPQPVATITVQTKPKSSLYQCDICGTTLKTKRSLHMHMTNHEKKVITSVPSEQRVCHICGKTNLKRLKQHLRDHRKAGQFKCSYCGKTFNRKQDQQHHERLHTGERPFVCEICAYSFTSASCLHRHRKAHIADAPHPNRKYQRIRTQNLPPPPPLSSSVSEPTNHTPPPLKQLTKHLPKIAKQKLLCPMCQRQFVNRQSIYQHLKFMHQPDGSNVWKRMLEITCMTCHESFASSAELLAHKPVHAEHECSICRRRFDNKIALQYHVNAHSTKERPHICELCNATFVTKKYLRQHFQRAHTDERPHVCTMCGKAFVQGCNLNYHVRMVHTQERRFQCTECPKAYKSSTQLRNHREKHTGQFRYSCSVCSKPCQSGQLLTAHMQAYHPDVEIP